tara:strand:+ start:2054 stop:2410 length:357 start_codon:yes stop_codon:yes gene_type:complete
MVARKSPRNVRKQKGGRVAFPSEYFGGNSGRYFAPGSVELNIGSSAYGANHATSRGTLIGQNLTGPDLGPTSHSGVQTGGYKQKGGAFNYITNPETNRKVKINSTLGKRILKNYLSKM